MPAVVFLVQRVGPYHHARFKAFAASSPSQLVVVEYRTTERTYGWDPVPEGGGYRRLSSRTPSELRDALAGSGATVLVCTGYSDPEVHAAAAWAIDARIPLVACSDSTFQDERRVWVREALKGRIVAAFDAALVAGTRSREYLGRLGLGSTRCFEPWDVVDNAHFAAGAAAARSLGPAGREKLGLPARYFLCVARFVPKKNLARLLEAFGRYSREAGPNGWSLVLSGSGPLEGDLRSQASRDGSAPKVLFTGFLQYGDLPCLYGLAEALVLPSLSDQWGLVVNEAMAAGLPVLVSNRCGCATDLVREKGNGLTFDPENAEALASAMADMAGLSPEARERMARESAKIISNYTPEAFAAGLGKAVAQASDSNRTKKPVSTRILVGLLAGRTGSRP
jgi:glycosyltransferase involved in cell wall biosynthesis